MGKFDVSLIRYLSAEDYRVLTAVSVSREINETFDGRNGFFLHLD